MMLLLIFGHYISYVGVNIDHHFILISPFILFFPVLFISALLKPRKTTLKYTPLWTKLVIIPVVFYVMLLIYYTSEHDKNIPGVADILNGEYVIHSHGIVKEQISRDLYDQLRSYVHRLSTAGLFLFYYILTLFMFSKYRQKIQICAIQFSNKAT